MGASAIVRARADWVGILDAAYATGSDDVTWAQGVLEALRQVFVDREGFGMQIVAHDPECRHSRSLVNLGSGPAGELAARASERQMPIIGPAGFRAFFYPPTMVVTHSEIDPMLDADARELMTGLRRSLGIADSIGIVVHPEPGVAMAAYCVLPKVASPTAHERRLLSQVGLHLEAAFRLRLRPEVVKAVVTLEGTRAPRIDAGASPADEKIAARARRIESTRASLRKGNHEAALDLWTALVAGHYSLVPRTEGGRRRYLVLENAPTSQEIRALSRRELDVLSMAVRGVSTKLVAYGLGLSPATVSSTLMTAASKLGLASRLELLRLAATLSGDPRACAMPATLTSAENAILDLLRQGLSNREIARVRSRSVRTIANQVASLLRKTKSGSRRELVATPSDRPSLTRR